jgi:hypothetical protein
LPQGSAHLARLRAAHPDGRIVALLALVAAGCVTPTAPGDQPDLAARPHAAAARPVAAAPVPVDTEVQVSGIVTRPAGAKKDAAGDVTVWITDGPCWQAATRAFGSTRARPDGTFAVDVFVRRGTQLWACGALGDPTKPMAWSGQAAAAPQLGKGVGEASFTNLEIPLARGKAVAAPPQR